MHLYGLFCWVAAMVLWSMSYMPAEASESISLKPQWRVDDTMYVEFTWSCRCIEIERDYPPEGHFEQSTLTFGFLHTVEEIRDDGQLKIMLAIDRIAFNIKCDENPLVRYDTDNPKKAALSTEYGDRLESILGMSMSVILDFDGQVKAIEGADRIYGILAVDERYSNSRELGKVAGSVLLLGQGDFLRQFYGPFASKPVLKGSSWASRVSNNPPIDVSYTLERIVHEVAGERAIVTHVAHINPPLKWDNPSDIIQVKTGPINLQGQTIIDLNTGRMISSEEMEVREVQVKFEKWEGLEPCWSSGHYTYRKRIIVMTDTERQRQKLPRSTNTQ